MVRESGTLEHRKRSRKRERSQSYESSEAWSQEACPSEAETSQHGQPTRLCFEGCPMNDESLGLEQSLDPPAQTELPLSQEVSDLYGKVRNWQTRLLRVEEGKLGDKINTELIVADLTNGEGIVLHNAQECIAYTALSYRWADPERTLSVLCNGILLPVTQNVYAAIQHLRSASAPVYLWIDAVSINQLDLEEKASQIQNMLKIFKKASRVVAWLGSRCSIASHRAIRCLRDHTWSLAHTDACHRLQRQDLRELWSNEWTRRTWVRQEVFAARSLVVQLGNVQISWKDFIHNHTDFSDDPSIACLRELIQSRGVGDSGDDIALVDAKHGPDCFQNSITPADKLFRSLISSALFQATNERDFVYGIMGMTDTPTSVRGQPLEPSGPSVPIDYQLSVVDVYKSVAIYLIESGIEVGRILSTSWLSNYRCQRNEKPTWVPDWRNLYSMELRELLSCRASYRCYTPQCKFRGFTAGLLSFRSASLQLPGFIVAYVSNPPATCGEPPEQHPFDDETEFEQLGAVRKYFIRLSLSLDLSYPDERRRRLVDNAIRSQHTTLHSRKPLLCRVEQKMNGWKQWIRIFAGNSLVPATVRVNDCVVVSPLSIVPFVLRSVAQMRYELVGPVLLPFDMESILDPLSLVTGERHTEKLEIFEII